MPLKLQHSHKHHVKCAYKEQTILQYCLRCSYSTIHSSKSSVSKYYAGLSVPVRLQLMLILMSEAESKN